MRALIEFCVLVLSAQADVYSDNRQMLITQEISNDAVGCDISLNANELILNATLMAAKTAEMDAGFANMSQFPPAQHFFHAKEAIDNSAVFQFIQQMPKFGALHTHDETWCSIEYVISNITYRDNLYVCIENGVFVNFVFADPAPTNSCWISLQELRSTNGSEQIDNILYSTLTLVTPDPVTAYPDTNTVWAAFTQSSNMVKSIIQYREVFMDYTYQALQEFYDDNVIYVELRASVPVLYELNGTLWSDPLEVFQLILNVTNQFKLDHPDFIGIKFIYAKNRNTDLATIAQYITNLEALVQAYPTEIIGFDLTGYEDPGLTLYAVSDLVRNITPPVKFFFHAGQTLTNGMSSDENLFDAVLLHSTRIGQAYALPKHEEIMLLVKEQNITIELCPIANQVLLLLNDMRNHPEVYLIENNFQLVISSSDPAAWGAKGISYDFYETFMGLASSHADLRMLKKFALNSIAYSQLTSEEQISATSQWLASWDIFVNNTITQSGL